METTILSVSQLNMYVKSLFQADQNLAHVCIRGEISNLSHHYKTGHLYFTLKDDKCSMKAVLFSSGARGLVFTPENGLLVLARGRVSVFERDGVYQLYVETLEPDGIGALHLAFEQLKEKLSAEGLFSEEYKKPIKTYPRVLGVITSKTGAVLQDIIHVVTRRYPLCKILLFPVSVQGKTAGGEIVAAFEEVKKVHGIDTVILARGGGSLEDLWPFNEERVARAIFACEVPVISAVGHETDFTIADFVADKRAPTPSAAAELAVPDMGVLRNILGEYRFKLQGLTMAKLDDAEKKLQGFLSRPVLASPVGSVELQEQRLSVLAEKLSERIKADYTLRLERLRGLSMTLDTLSPLKTMLRGFSIIFLEDKIVSKTDMLHVGDAVSIKLSDGEAKADIREIHPLKKKRREKSGTEADL